MSEDGSLVNRDEKPGTGRGQSLHVRKERHAACAEVSLRAGRPETARRFRRQRHNKGGFGHLQILERGVGLGVVTWGEAFGFIGICQGEDRRECPRGGPAAIAKKRVL